MISKKVTQKELLMYYVNEYGKINYRRVENAPISKGT